MMFLIDDKDEAEYKRSRVVLRVRRRGVKSGLKFSISFCRISATSPVCRTIAALIKGSLVEKLPSYVDLNLQSVQ